MNIYSPYQALHTYAKLWYFLWKVNYNNSNVYNNNKFTMMC